MNRSGQQTRMCALLIFVVSSLKFGAFLARNDCHTVVTLLPEDTRAITDARKFIKGKLIVCALRLLHAKDVWLNRLKPTDGVWQARDY
jgi:hypothetical protein